MLRSFRVLRSSQGIWNATLQMPTCPPQALCPGLAQRLLQRGRPVSVGPVSVGPVSADRQRKDHGRGRRRVAGQKHRPSKPFAFDRQLAEFQIRVAILNRFTPLERRPRGAQHGSPQGKEGPQSPDLHDKPGLRQSFGFSWASTRLINQRAPRHSVPLPQGLRRIAQYRCAATRVLYILTEQSISRNTRGAHHATLDLAQTGGD